MRVSDSPPPGATLTGQPPLRVAGGTNDPIKGVEVDIEKAPCGGSSNPCGIAMGVELNNPSYITIGATTVIGEKLIFRRITEGGEAHLTGVQLKAKDPHGPRAFKIDKDEKAKILGAEVSALGDARLSATSDTPAQLKLKTGGTGGGAGVTGASDPIKGIKPSRSLAISTNDPDSTGGLPDGAEIAVRAVGLYAGDPAHGLGTCWASKAISQPGVKRVAASFAVIGETKKRVELWNGGTLVYSDTTSLDSIAKAKELPKGSKYDTQVASLGGAGFVLVWSTPTIITIGGTEYTATELRVGPASTPAAAGPEAIAAVPEDITELEVTVKDIPELLITEITVEDLPTTTDVPGARVPGVALRAFTWPIPSSGAVWIRFALPVAGRFRADVYDLGGRIVRRVADHALAAGEHVFAWDGRSGAGGRVSPGVYFVRGRLEAAGRSAEDVNERFVILR